MSRFDKALSVVEPLGHGLIVRYTRTLMDAGHFEEARVFVEEAARRLGSGALSDLAHGIKLWTYGKGTKSELAASAEWREARRREQYFPEMASELHRQPSLASLRILEIQGLGSQQLGSTQSGSEEGLNQTHVWIRPHGPATLEAISQETAARGQIGSPITLREKGNKITRRGSNSGNGSVLHPPSHATAYALGMLLVLCSLWWAFK